MRRVVQATNIGQAYLHIFKTVLLSDAPQHVLLATLLHLSRQQQLVQDKVCFLEVEDDVELANVAVVFVHLLHEAVNNLQCDQLIVGRVDAGDEEERGVAAIDNFGICLHVRSVCQARASSEEGTFVL